MKQLVHVSLQNYLDKNVELATQLEMFRSQFDDLTNEEIVKKLQDMNINYYGIEETIIASHMINLAKRAIEINDKPILDILIALGVIEEIKSET